MTSKTFFLFFFCSILFSFIFLVLCVLCEYVCVCSDCVSAGGRLALEKSRRFVNKTGRATSRMCCKSRAIFFLSCLFSFFFVVCVCVQLSNSPPRPSSMLCLWHRTLCLNVMPLVEEEEGKKYILYLKEKRGLSTGTDSSATLWARLDGDLL